MVLFQGAVDASDEVCFYLFLFFFTNLLARNPTFMDPAFLGPSMVDLAFLGIKADMARFVT